MKKNRHCAKIKILSAGFAVLFFGAIFTAAHSVSAQGEIEDLSNLSSGAFIKSPKSSAVYVYYKSWRNEAWRFVVPNAKTFLSWIEPDVTMMNIHKISDAQLATLPLKGNLTYKPGVKMIKITTSPKTYAVENGGVLRWIKTEETARALYGQDWNKKIDDVPDEFFADYKIGGDIGSPENYTFYKIPFNGSVADNIQEYNILRNKEELPPAVPLTSTPTSETPSESASSTPPATSTPAQTEPAAQPSQSSRIEYGIRWAVDTPSGIKNPDAEQPIAKIIMKNDLNPGNYNLIIKAINFAVSSSGVTLTETRKLGIYQTSRTGRLLATFTFDPAFGHSFSMNSAITDADFYDIDILPGDEAIFYATLDTRDAYLNSKIGITIPLNGVIWSDGVSTINNMEGLPLDMKTFAY